MSKLEPRSVRHSRSFCGSAPAGWADSQGRARQEGPPGGALASLRIAEKMLHRRRGRARRAMVSIQELSEELRLYVVHGSGGAMQKIVRGECECSQCVRNSTPSRHEGKIVASSAITRRETSLATLAARQISRPRMLHHMIRNSPQLLWCDAEKTAANFPTTEGVPPVHPVRTFTATEGQHPSPHVAKSFETISVRAHHLSPRTTSKLRRWNVPKLDNWQP